MVGEECRNASSTIESWQGLWDGLCEGGYNYAIMVPTKVPNSG